MTNWHDRHQANATLGERLSDRIAAGMGSWPFIIWQTVLVIVWMALNTIGIAAGWDVYPFILLNLLFSTQAAYAAPIIMMSQNRAAAQDKAQADHEYHAIEEQLAAILDHLKHQ